MEPSKQRRTNKSDNVRSCSHIWLKSNPTKTVKPSPNIIFLCTIVAILILLFFHSTKPNAIVTQQKVVAITQIVNHDSLTQAKKGILDELVAHGYRVGDNLKIIDKNAQGNIATAILIAKQFVNLKPNAIVAISTPSAQTIAHAVKNKQIPVVFASVTDPIAAGIIKDPSSPELLITGAVDSPPIQETITLINSFVPKVKVLGFIYNSGETNAVKSVQLMKKIIGKNIKIAEATVTNTNQIKQSLQALLGKVDAIYIPSDNTVFSAMATIVTFARTHKLAIFSNDPDSVRQGILACVGYTQYEVGRVAGKLLVATLEGKKQLPIKKPEKVQVFVNKITAASLNIKIPAQIVGRKVNITK